MAPTCPSFPVPGGQWRLDIRPDGNPAARLGDEPLHATEKGPLRLSLLPQANPSVICWADRADPILNSNNNTPFLRPGGGAREVPPPALSGGNGTYLRSGLICHPGYGTVPYCCCNIPSPDTGQ